MATRSEVLAFLNQFKGCVALALLKVKDREKNRQALIDLGITPGGRREILLGLTPEDYVAGPMPDDTDGTKEVWVFGAAVDDTEVYIKLRAVEDKRHKGRWHAVVWSFHRAEHPMRYPLRGGRA